MVKISEIVNQNPWWKHGRRFVHFDKNLMEANKKPIFFKRKQVDLDKGNIYILRGSRQVGKTTYIKKLISILISKGTNPNNILYLSSDFFISRRELRNAITYFIDKNIDKEDLYIFIDEITSLADWNVELKYLSDSGILEKSRILATGSSASALRKKGELLPGRGLEGNEYYMKPLSFREFILQATRLIRDRIREQEFRDSLKALESTLKENHITLGHDFDGLAKSLNSIAPFKRELEYLFTIYLRCGGYPFAVNDCIAPKSEVNEFSINFRLSEILVRNILGDLTKLGKQETLIRQILREVIEKYGNRYSFSKLAHDVGTTHVTTIDYLEALEESFILTILYALDLNKKKPKFKGDKKIYFRDPFVFHSVKSFLTGIDVNKIIEETLQNEEARGKLVEGIVLSHLIMNQEIPMMRETQTFSWYYYNTRGKEIDNVLRVDDIYLAIEVKYQKKVASKDIWRMPQLRHFMILTKEDLKTDGENLLAPVDVFLAILEKSHRNL